MPATRQTLELENARLRSENAELRAIYARNMEALKESSALLLKSKPSRPHIAAEKKLFIKNADLVHKTGGVGVIGREDRRLVRGKFVMLEPTDLDIETILFECDVNRDGHINRAETIAALAVWSKLAAQRVEDENTKAAGSCCGVQ